MSIYLSIYLCPSFDESAGTLFLKNSVATPLCVSHRLRRYIGRTYVYLSIYLCSLHGNFMKISTEEATWELIYTDRWTDRRTDRRMDGRS
jgi:hypothetical protein